MLETHLGEPNIGFLVKSSFAQFLKRQLRFYTAECQIDSDSGLGYITNLMQKKFCSLLLSVSCFR